MKGDKTISSEWLINQSTHEGAASFKWLDNEHIVYELNGNIELIDVEKQVRQPLGKGSNVTPSPDGQWIAYTIQQDDLNQIWIMDRNGSRKQPVIKMKEGIDAGSFAWSNDSKQLGYIVNAEEPMIQSQITWKKVPSSIYIFNLSIEH